MKSVSEELLEELPVAGVVEVVLVSEAAAVAAGAGGGRAVPAPVAGLDILRTRVKSKDKQMASH